MTKRGLGKGLHALLPDAPTGETLMQAPLDAIVSNPDQPRTRFDEAALQDLAESIRQHGVLQPIVLQQMPDGRYQLIAGERRTRAARIAGLTTIPAVVRRASGDQRLVLALIENLQRTDISPIEQARAYKQLIDRFGLTQDEVAKQVGRSRTAVTNSLRLLQLPDSVLQQVEQGALSEGHARTLLMAPESQREALAKRAPQMSVRELERAARAAMPSATPDVSRETSALDPDLQRVCDVLRERLSTRVTLSLQGRGGTLHIGFYDHEDLDRLLLLIAGESLD